MIRAKLIPNFIWVILIVLIGGCKEVIIEPYQRIIPGLPDTFWSPDGKYISHAVYKDTVFVEVAESVQDFSPIELLANDISKMNARWSYDGTKLAFITDEGEGDVIKTYDFVSGELSTLTDNLVPNVFSKWFLGDLDIRSLNWSPDNQRIAFAVKLSDTQDIYLVNADGTNAHKVIEDGMKPIWAPDGKTIAFERNDDIYLFNIEQDEETQLTFSPKIESDPLWSPNGQMIVYTVFQNYNYEIYLMNADGSEQVNITNNPAVDFWASWSPDGQIIMFTSLRDDQLRLENGEIYLYYLEENELHRLTNTPNEDEFEPIWSPDGKRIAFWSHSISRLEQSLYIMDIDSGERIFVQSIDWR